MHLTYILVVLIAGTLYASSNALPVVADAETMIMNGGSPDIFASTHTGGHRLLRCVEKYEDVVEVKEGGFKDNMNAVAGKLDPAKTAGKNKDKVKDIKGKVSKSDCNKLVKHLQIHGYNKG
ncbi:hypothetical protein L914_00243 [Phytophthora nicotianae]|uniref:RxLR effector protein n=1 Tax=Phytophthora nicotianae TaxID=4792 RepID=W2P869_PHYNI|nr:hypothetical protein L914_00243 [Phytophthora nicotianae]